MKNYPILYLLGLMVIIMAGLLPFEAFAGDLKAEAKAVSTQLVILPKFIAFIAYTIGSFFAARSLFALKGFIQDPDENPVTKFLGFAAVSALLIMLPYIVQVTANSIMVSKSPTAQSSYGSFQNNVDCPVDGTFNAIFCNLVVEISPFARFLAVISYVMAAVITLIGFINLKDYGDDPSQVPIRSIIMKFVLAVLLISLPLAMEVFVKTVTGVDKISATEQVKKPSLYRGSIK